MKTKVLKELRELAKLTRKYAITYKTLDKEVTRIINQEAGYLGEFENFDITSYIVHYFNRETKELEEIEIVVEYVDEDEINPGIKIKEVNRIY